MACTVLAGCNKENPENPLTPEQFFEKVQGKWAGISYDFYEDQEAFKNGISQDHEECEAGKEGTEGLIIHHDEIISGDEIISSDGIISNYMIISSGQFKDGKVYVDSSVKILANDGKKLEAKNFDNDSIIIEWLKGDRLRQTIYTDDGHIAVIIYVRTDFEEVFPPR